MSALASDPLSTPFTGVGGGGDPFGGITTFGFSIPQGNPGDLEAASDTCRRGGIALSSQGEGVGQGTQVAADGWEGEAQAAFSGYATLAGMVLDSNTHVFYKTAGALDRLASELARAQKVTRQAASDCERYQQQLTAASQEASQLSQNAENLSQQAALAAHPHAAAQLNQQAAATSDLAQAAQGQANRASAGLEAARQQGRSAERAYQQQAETIASQIQAASAEIQIVERMPGGAPIPISVSAADVNLAKRMLRGAGSLQNAAKAARDPALLRRLAGGKLSPAAIAVFLRALRIDEENAEKPKLGSIWDAAGGYFHAASFGILNFGNSNTARYRAGEIDAAIPLDPDALAVDGVDGAKVFESDDPLVGDLANTIEKEFPGEVRGVNVPAYDADGVLRTDLDIDLNDSVIQVKAGRGRGIGGQVTRTQATTEKQVIVYGPKLGPFAQAEAQSRGAVVFTSPEALLRYLAGEP